MTPARSALLAVLLLCTTAAYHPPHRSIARTVALRAQRTYTLTDAEGATDLLEITNKAEGRTFVLDGSKMMTLYECSFYEGKLGYQVWPAALAGAAWACKNKALFEGKRVLELGSGVGLFGCAIAAVTDASSVTLTDLDAVNERDFDAPSGLLDAQRRTCVANGFDQVDSQRVDWADASSWLEPADVVICADCVYAPEAIEPLANCIAHHLAEGGVVYAFSAERDWSDAKYARAAPSDLEEALLAVGLSVATARSSITTASGVYDVVLHTAGRITDETTTGVGRRSVLGATVLAFAPRAHAVEADPRTDIKARADYVEKEAQSQGFRTSRINVLKVEPGPTAATGCMRSRDADVVEIDYVGSVVDGGVFDRRSRFAAMLGSGEVLKGLELGLYDMCIGERRVLRVPPALAFGDRGSRAFGVPGGATLEYDVTLRGINLQYNPSVRREDLDFEQRF
jgi:FKBP-type peptidyl-prolyl cis-trans isomerase